MEWEAIRDNLGLIIFGAVWLLSLLARAFRRGRGRSAPEGGRRRRGSRGRSIVFGLILMVVAVTAWNLAGGFPESEASIFRLAAFVLAAVAVLAVLAAGFTRSGPPTQADVGFEIPQQRAAEIESAEPLEPR